MVKFLPINQNQSLYSLLGTAYGGDERTTFDCLKATNANNIDDNGSNRGFQWEPGFFIAGSLGWNLGKLIFE